MLIGFRRFMTTKYRGIESGAVPLFFCPKNLGKFSFPSTQRSTSIEESYYFRIFLGPNLSPLGAPLNYALSPLVVPISILTALLNDAKLWASRYQRSSNQANFAPRPSFPWMLIRESFLGEQSTWVRSQLVAGKNVSG